MSEGIKVRMVEDKPISNVELEKKLLNEKEEQDRAAELASQDKKEEPVVETKTETKAEPVVETKAPEKRQIEDEDVLSHIKTRYNKELTTLDDLFKPVEKTEVELPSDVDAFLKYKKETGRSFDDFARLQRDLDKVDERELLIDYYKQVEEMDDEDIKFVLGKFDIDEDLDEDDVQASKRLGYKQELKKAKKYAEEQKEKYKAPLESSESFIPEDQKASYEAFKAYESAKLEKEEKDNKRSEFFSSEIDKLYSDKFEGFEFNVNENTKLSFKPAEASAMKEQAGLDKFINKFLSEDGFITDVAGFQRALSIAMDPDGAAKFFYENGHAAAIAELEKEGKNINMTRQVPPASPEGGMKIRLAEEKGGGTQVKFRKN